MNEILLIVTLNNQFNSTQRRTQTVRFFFNYVHPWWGIIFREVRRVHRFILFKTFMMFPMILCRPLPLLWGSVLLCLQSPEGGCCSISDDMSCSVFGHKIPLMILQDKICWKWNTVCVRMSPNFLSIQNSKLLRILSGVTCQVVKPPNEQIFACD